MQRTLRALSLLLSYPEADIVTEVAELYQVVESEGHLDEAATGNLREFVTYWAQTPILQLQQAYVAWFDRRRSLSLHLFEHVHGEGRDRGQAMVDLTDVLRRAGWGMRAGELPDYLPAMCEFCSLVSPQAARQLLCDIAPILQLLEGRLSELHSPYRAILGALAHLASARTAVAASASDVQLSSELDLETIDRQWEDAPITFSVGAAHDSCEVSNKPQATVALRRSAQGTPLT